MHITNTQNYSDIVAPSAEPETDSHAQEIQETQAPIESRQALPRTLSGKSLYQKLMQDLRLSDGNAGNSAASTSEAVSITNSRRDQTSSDNLIALVRSTLVAQQQEVVLQPSDEAWRLLHDVDRQRIAGTEHCSLLQQVPELLEIAADSSHVAHADAALLRDVLTRPIGQKLSLEDFLAQKVESGLYLFMQVPKQPDVRTFNSMLPGLAVSTSDYGSMGRTFLLKGATHLIGIPSAPDVRDAQLAPEDQGRKERVQTTVFHFAKDSIVMNDFNQMIDPLDPLNVYESMR